MKCPHCERDMTLVGFGNDWKTYECLYNDCGEGYETEKVKESPEDNKEQ